MPLEQLLGVNPNFDPPPLISSSGGTNIGWVLAPVDLLGGGHGQEEELEEEEPRGSAHRRRQPHRHHLPWRAQGILTLFRQFPDGTLELN